jgi:hypothetical protein
MGMLKYRGIRSPSRYTGTLLRPFYSCLRNVVTIFHVIEKELKWREARGQLAGFEAMLASKPIVAVGADHPLEDELLMADYFRKQSCAAIR